MLLKKAGLAAAAAAAVGAGVLGATTIADAASSEESSPGHRYGAGAEGGGEHTEVTGAELTQVTDAVTAHDASVTVESVRKDADGSYDVEGTRAGSGVRLEVSADLATVTEGAGHGPGGHGPGGPGPDGRGPDGRGPDGRGPDGARDGGRGSSDTPVTGAALTEVTDAVTAHDPTLTVQSVRQNPDGSYDVFVTGADGSRAMLEVSADLGTFTEHSGGPGHRHGGEPDGPGDDASAGAASDS